MSVENLKKFCQVVLQDLSLQNQLKNPNERDEFFARVIELAAESGFEILREDIEQQLRENKRLWHERWI